MNIGAYLPSARFALLAVSLALAGGLVAAAEYFTAPQPPAQVSVAQAPAANPSWQAALYRVEAASASSSLSAANPGAAQALLAAAHSNNVTDTVGKTLLVNLANAESQGLGSNAPTQSALAAAAAEQVAHSQATTSTYTLANLTLEPSSNDALHTYGNEVMQVFAQNPDANEQAAFIAVDAIVEGKDESKVAVLGRIGAAYQALAEGLAAVPVPQTLAPLHLQVINTLMQASATFADMETVGTDPLRGLAGLQEYESLMETGQRVFTNIAQELNNDGILFNKDEPGSAWSAFVSPT